MKKKKENSQTEKQMIARLKRIVTDKIANDVKYLRCAEGYTWRAVCRDMAKKYPELKLMIHSDGSGFQIDGMILCQICEEYLNENGVDWN